MGSVLKYYEDAPGKMLRSKYLISMFSKQAEVFGTVLESTTERAKTAAESIETIHLASLIHDDILDGAETRRELQTIVARYGINSALLAGDVMFSRALQQMHSIGDEMIMAKTLEILNLMCEGQMQENSYALLGVTPTQEELIETIEKKTGSLFALAAFVGTYLVLSEKSDQNLTPEMTAELEKVTQDGYYYGVVYQLRDDLKDIEDDLNSGSVTFPIVFGEEVTNAVIANIVSKLK
ncbi:MAG: polyprenyl synthetase family protein [Candidatus Ancillula sp.]|jgi:geranylgeranyl pyrophosphate synthase|nr:polyprenyl synthetase family protein [Candidatus Ancillula sp.]